MNRKQQSASDRFSTRTLVLGFFVTLALTLATTTAIVIELGQAQQRAVELADEGQHATFYLGNVGEQLSRLHAQVALGRHETPEEFARRAELRSQIESSLQEDMDGLGFGLGRGPGQPPAMGQRRWMALRPDIERLRKAYEDIGSFIRQGQGIRAAGLLDEQASLATKVYEGIDNITQAHHESMLGELHATRRQVSVARAIAIAIGCISTLVMLGVWGAVIKRLGGKGRRLVEANARLESANADLDAFAGRVAHDLRNALVPVVMSPSVLRHSAADLTQVLEIADRIERCSKRAIAVVDALLAFSRASRGIESGESGAIQSTVKNVLEELGPLAARVEVSVEVEEIPDVHVRCNPGLLHIVLANLAGNAIKYLDGQTERSVRISVRAEDSSCRIEVEDTGPGIPADAREKIFEPFYRVEGTRGPGTGIGLATVRRIVDARGGRITVESEAGKGSRFIVWLPTAPRPEDYS